MAGVLDYQRIQEGNQDIVRDLVTLLHVPGIASGKVCGTQGVGHACLIKRNEFQTRRLFVILRSQPLLGGPRHLSGLFLMPYELGIF